MQGVSNETHRKLQAALQLPDEENVLHVTSAGNCKDC